ncbi:glutathione S-transferase family protein [Bradyrhizobium sp. USDA 4454]
MSQPTPILHHFDQSPFSEKIRIIFGFKQLAWNSVRISRIMPRPDLMPMTGGYRRTPTMQIGADIYCDTQIIIRELERRYPTPTVFPAGNAGMPWALGMWADRPFFQNTVNLVFGCIGDKVPQDFIADREKLRGAKFDVAAMTAALPQMRDQFRANLDWIEAQLGNNRPWLFGEFSLADVSASMNVWYARQSLATMDEIMKGFPHVAAWEERIRSIGHGTRTEMSAADALEIAAAAQPESPVFGDPADPNGRKPGDIVSVMPDDYGKIPVRGEIVSLSAQHIAIRRSDERIGEVVVHFPRAGFLVIPG